MSFLKSFVSSPNSALHLRIINLIIDNLQISNSTNTLQSRKEREREKKRKEGQERRKKEKYSIEEIEILKNIL